ncbi:ABC transporter ATP-binding protein [Thiomonas sp. FB-6]|uniref:ABC transporter ATP-binding protein n=1 Tax=Thiomonas sp. FB-6 TaxID=1158291 RepID=UPI000364C77D|nr:ABC transporter ATP-binding protein [Thiomonas sp. FB-6]
MPNPVPSTPAVDTRAPRGLRIEQVSKWFDRPDEQALEVLHPIDLDIESGAFVALIGPSGCGKSTLLNIIAGFEAATRGSVLVNGERVRGPHISRGMVFQQYALFHWLSVRENIGFGLRNSGVPKAERDRRVEHYLRLIGLEGFGSARPAALSGGMKQRVALARAFATDPDIILMDEPFGALDALTRGFLQQELLRIWREHRKTVLLVTHSVQEALFLATRVIVFTRRPGRVKLDLRIELEQPRHINEPGFRELEARILEALHEELLPTAKPEAPDMVTD